MSGRILPHASACRYFSSELRDLALLDNAKASLSSKIDAGSSSGKSDMFADFRRAGQENKADARKQRIEKTNLLVLDLLCDGALPPKLVDSRAFRALVDYLQPANGIVVSTTFSTNYIPAEAAKVTVLSIEKLKTYHNLTISYDGGTTKGHQSIYTVHVTTPDRVAHLIKGDEASGFSHTGEHIKKVVMDVIRMIGRERFSAFGSDSTGNTTWTRDSTADEIPTLFIVPDPCHHLSSTVGEITRLPYFTNAILKTRVTITHFSHSTYSATHLKALRVIFDINKGLEKIGKTRFGTIYWAGYALLRCLPPIDELFLSGIITTDGAEKSKLAWFKQFRVRQEFETELRQLCTILEPIARAIKCLEGLEVTVGDVWKFYVAITAVIRDLFQEDVLSFPQSLQDDVCSIVNRRFNEMINGPSGDIYLAGFYLDPEHVKSPLLFKANANQLGTLGSLPTAPRVSRSGVTDQDLRDSMPAYPKVGIFLKKALAKELQAGRQDPAFSRYTSGAQILDAFKIQFEAYTRQYPPFSARRGLVSTYAILGSNVCTPGGIHPRLPRYQNILNTSEFSAGGAHRLAIH
ncbi:ribonuclease H-like domain-containing protein [Mycena sanguinolenta]|nr:ribonuclease H-like domain-containing protein [Mycena sanguinolenta]